MSSSVISESFASPELPENFGERMRELGFEKKEAAPSPSDGIRYIRRAEKGSPALEVHIHTRRNAGGALMPAVSVDGSPYRVYGGYVEALQTPDPDKIIAIIRGRLEHYRGISAKK